MSDFAVRLRSTAKEVGGLNRLAELAKVNRRTLGNWLTGTTPNPEALTRIAKVAGVSVDWLLTGEGDMYGRSDDHELVLPDRYLNALPTKAQLEAENEEFEQGLSAALQRHERERGKSDPSKRFVTSFDPDEGIEGWSSNGWHPSIKGGLPEIDVRLGAGEGSVGEMVSIPSNGGFSGHKVVAEWVFPDTFLTSILGADAARCIVQEVIGDSMSPTYQPGDRVIVDLSQTKLTTDTVYAISDGEAEPQIKRLQRVPFSDPPMVKIISDNPNLETFEAQLERVHIIGRIIGVVARR